MLGSVTDIPALRMDICACWSPPLILSSQFQALGHRAKAAVLQAFLGK